MPYNKNISEDSTLYCTVKKEKQFEVSKGLAYWSKFCSHSGWKTQDG